ncbi:nucleoside deaminase [Aequorivita xiaoshiensis]|uniref:Nucleoside deaminase n=1 Tax=Aequorivita xiaoshiensis TaxID=2874476 RepID=A0A9X1R009_9FLAO|nr:nucleoside deaminase [Aequorivita xiaoshiensis]MCG2431826.1 nucleoside deaminase [Aequorivita xiaoshiensis]
MDTFFSEALKEAEIGIAEGGIPVGAVLVHNGEIIGRGHNKRVQKGSPIIHAEMDAIENAGRQSVSVYKESVLYTTLSPCPMCAGAILHYGIPKIVIGENTNYLGAEDMLIENGVSVIVLNDRRCKQLVDYFISENPELWNEDVGAS